jgi:hypothetical protein
MFLCVGLSYMWGGLVVEVQDDNFCGNRKGFMGAQTQHKFFPHGLETMLYHTLCIP